jgi:LiaF transmembrane domain/N-terminal domain of toast_rack, DUF2154
MAREPLASSRTRPARSVVGPVLLVAVGVLILLNNVGAVPWSIWPALWPYWPVLFVLLGIEAIISGRLSWGGLVLTLMLVAFGGFAIHASETVWGWPREASGGPPRTQFRQYLGGAVRAHVRIQQGGGALDIRSHREGGVLAIGNVHGRGSLVEPRYQVRNGVGELRIESRGDWHTEVERERGRERLDLQLSSDVPIELRVEAGASDANLDLRDLRIDELRLETGASRASVVLPASGQTRVFVQGMAAGLQIQVPDGVAARIAVESPVADVRIDEARFPRRGGVYQSPDFEGAPNQVDMAITVAAARLDVQ